MNREGADQFKTEALNLLRDCASVPRSSRLSPCSVTRQRLKARDHETVLTPQLAWLLYYKAMPLVENSVQEPSSRVSSSPPVTVQPPANEESPVMDSEEMEDLILQLERTRSELLERQRQVIDLQGM